MEFSTVLYNAQPADRPASFYADWLSTFCEAERSERAKGKASKRKQVNPSAFLKNVLKNL